MLNTLHSNIGGVYLFLTGGDGGGQDGGGTSVAAVAITAVAGIAVFAAIVYTRSGRFKSPWSYKRRHALTPQQWRNSFTEDGKLHDGGIKLLKKVRSGGIDPNIRAEVWPFLLGVYDLNSSKEERGVVRNKNRKEYEKLRKQSRQLLRQIGEQLIEDSDSSTSEPNSPTPENIISTRKSFPCESPVIYSDSSDMGSSHDVDDDDDDDQFDEASPPCEQEDEPIVSSKGNLSLPETKLESNNISRTEDFASWQRIIRLDAVRANAEWIPYSPSQAGVSEAQACPFAESVGLKDYDHLDPCRVYHAARLVAILEAYSIYDSEIGYCQGMSDLLTPIISVIEEDDMAFWCFVGFMNKARHNFRLDEVGIQRQLNIVAKIIKHKDSHLYQHLVKLQAEDCFFVYRMVVVLFRRELNFEQILCLWEVMWADQVALRAGLGTSAWSRIRQRAPPTENLLLYAIAASVLQRRKQIIEKYKSMDEIIRECNNMAGQLDVWKLLDDAHDLVMRLHDKVSPTF